MIAKDKYDYINIKEFINIKNKKDKIGERYLKEVYFSDFVCPKNPDVERFLKNNSIEFSKKEQTTTYLVLSKRKHDLLGYFSIAIKPITIKSSCLGGKNSRTRKKAERFSDLDEGTQSYTLPAFLIAQLGKNFNDSIKEKITGAELLELAFTIIDEIKYRGGGAFIFIETLNEPKLINFYNKSGFDIFDTRITKSNVAEKHELIQMLKLS